MGVIPSVDLRYLFGPCRDQGSRPTCLSFAVSDTHASLRQPWEALSCEYLFFHAQMHASRSPHQGASVGAVLTVLKGVGQPVETAYPYLAQLPEDLSFYGPSNALSVFRRNSAAGQGKLDGIVATLDAKTPVVMVLDLSDSFYTPNVEGVVVAPLDETPDPARRHAVVAVGYGVFQEGTAILVRNSWGVAWGIGGYAWLPSSYLVRGLVSAIVLLEEVHVSGTHLAA